MVNDVARGHDPELVARLQAAVVPAIEVEEVVIGKILLLGFVLGPDDRGDEVLGLRPDVPETGDFVLVAERLGGRVGRVGRRGRVDPGDSRRGLGESATGELRRLLSKKSGHPSRKEKGHWTGKANGETHGDSLKNTDIRGF